AWGGRWQNQDVGAAFLAAAFFAAGFFAAAFFAAVFLVAVLAAVFLVAFFAAFLAAFFAALAGRGSISNPTFPVGWSTRKALNLRLVRLDTKSVSKSVLPSVSSF